MCDYWIFPGRVVRGRTSDQADPSFPIPLIPFIPAASLERVMQVHRPLRIGAAAATVAGAVVVDLQPRLQRQARLQHDVDAECLAYEGVVARSEEHTSELQSLMRTSYAV